MWRLILSLGVFLRISAAWAISPAPPAPPTQWVTDQVGYLSEAAIQDLNFRLETYESESGHQLLVYLDRSTGQIPLEDWTARAFEAWGVGQKSLDDGLVLFVFVDDKRARIEVGYGLEAVVPDVVAARILREVLTPKMQANERDGAISETMNSLIIAIDGKLPKTTIAPQPKTFSLFQMISTGVLVLAFVLLLIFKPSWALFLLYMFIRRGGGGGGGGFSGGGGRSGGGGASGGW